MATKSFIALTPDPADKAASSFLTNRNKFPLEPLLTGDLNKARIWGHVIAARRFVQRHPELAQFGRFRSTKLPADVGAAAVELQSKPIAIPAPADPEPAPRKRPTRKPTSTRRTKTDPNKRLSRAKRLKATRATRRKLGKPRRGRERTTATIGA